MKYGQELPKNVEAALDAYIERIKAIKWFAPKKLSKKTVDAQIKLTLKAFGVEAGIEYRRLTTSEDWDASRDASRDASWDASWVASRDASWVASRVASRVASWDASWDAADGSSDLLASLTPDGKYAKKYPHGNFLQLVVLWEMGLYPIGVIDGKFVCYVPTDKGDVTELVGKEPKK